MIYLLIKQGSYCDQCDRMERVNLLASSSRERLEYEKNAHEDYEAHIEAANKDFNKWWREVKPFSAPDLVEQFQAKLMSLSEYQEKVREHDEQAKERITVIAQELGDKHGVTANEARSGNMWYYVIEEVRTNDNA
jgi:hypothetical protein